MSDFKKKTRLYKVYHIHEIGNLDVTEGYVGITRRSLMYRLGQHFNSKRPVGVTLRKLGRDNVSIRQLAMLPKVEALAMEYALRPALRIGWNVRAGGDRSTVRCPSCGKLLPKRKTNSYCAECHDTKFVKGQLPFNYGTGKRYKITAPTGEVFTPISLVQFCHKHSLTPQNLRQVATGKRKHHKGWIAIELSGG